MSARRLFVAAGVLFALASAPYAHVTAAGSGTRLLRSPIENEGVAPDIDSENWPKDGIGGHDPQRTGRASGGH